VGRDGPNYQDKKSVVFGAPIEASHVHSDEALQPRTCAMQALSGNFLIFDKVDVGTIDPSWGG